VVPLQILLHGGGVSISTFLLVCSLFIYFICACSLLAGAITILVVILYMDIPHPKTNMMEKLAQIDYLGVLTLVPGVICLLLSTRYVVFLIGNIEAYCFLLAGEEINMLGIVVLLFHFTLLALSY
jgi:hypothetical protein